MKLVLISVLFFVQTTICLGQDFFVHLIDVRNGRPFPNQPVTIQYRKAAGESFETFTVKTDENGSAAFHLPLPMTSKVSVRAYALYPCYDLQPIDTQQLKLGLASHCSKLSQGCHCKFGKQTSQIKPRTGEVILLARPVTHWEKFLEHIWE